MACGSPSFSWQVARRAAFRRPSVLMASGNSPPPSPKLKGKQGAAVVAIAGGGGERKRAHVNWSIYEKITVSFAFTRKLTFLGLKRYISIGQLRELVAQELLLPSTNVALEVDGRFLLVNSMTLEDALGTSTNLHMVRAYPCALPLAPAPGHAPRPRAPPRPHR